MNIDSKSGGTLGIKAVRIISSNHRLCAYSHAVKRERERDTYTHTHKRVLNASFPARFSFLGEWAVRENCAEIFPKVVTSSQERWVTMRSAMRTRRSSVQRSDARRLLTGEAVGPSLRS